MEWKVREGEKRDGERVRVGYADTGVHCHDDSSSAADGGASMDALSLDQLAHTLAGGRDPRDSKSCRLTGHAFARTCSAAQRSPSPAPFPTLAMLDLSACAGLDDSSLAAAPRPAGSKVAGAAGRTEGLGSSNAEARERSATARGAWAHR